MWKAFSFFRGANTDDLLAAIEVGNFQAFRKIIRKSPQILDQKNKFGMSPLMFAILHAQKEMVKALLEAGANPNIPHEFATTPLMMSIVLEHENIEVLLLAKEELQLDLQDQAGATALIYAIQRLREDSVSRLLEAGANPDLRDNDGETPIMYAVKVENTNMLLALIKKGADLRARDFDGLSVMDKVIDKEMEALLHKHL
ncbi:MAG: ankyrin repeat domain-containing protein [Bacteroidia bacterium]|nr:ankyrin repeat domain-containing protein [Bacteroidia bacterium]